MNEEELKSECIAFAEYVAKQDLRWKHKSLDTLWTEYRGEFPELDKTAQSGTIV